MATHRTTVYSTVGEERVEVGSEDDQRRRGGSWGWDDTGASHTEAVGFVAQVKEMSDEPFRAFVKQRFQECATTQLVAKLQEDGAGESCCASGGEPRQSSPPRLGAGFRTADRRVAGTAPTSSGADPVGTGPQGKAPGLTAWIA